MSLAEAAGTATISVLQRVTSSISLNPQHVEGIWGEQSWS
jgi:hypothetical protein